MEHTLTSGAVIADRPRPAKNYLNETTGLWSWMSTVDHKRIGIMYLGAVCFAFLLGGIFALLVRRRRHTLISHTHGTLRLAPSTRKAYNTGAFRPVTSTGDTPEAPALDDMAAPQGSFGELLMRTGSGWNQFLETTTKHGKWAKRTPR